MTRDEYITEIRHHADAESDGRWPVTRVMRMFDTVMRREWRNLINANRYLRTALRTPTVTNGRFAVADLTQGVGDAQEIFYRVIGVYVGTRPYQEVQPVDLLTIQTDGATAAVWGHETWHRNGDYIYVVPQNVDGTLNVLVNHLPPLPSALSGGTVEVAFPEGYEQVPALETAAMLLAKGGTETEATRDLKSLAEEMRRDMLSDLTRISTNPVQMRYPDRAEEWGG